MMNWFDILISVLLLIAFINGYRRGLIMQLVGLATIVLAAIFGGKLAATILPELNRLINLAPDVARVLSFVLAFALIAVGISLIGRLLERFINVVFLSFINRIIGAIVAVGTMMVFLSVLLNLVLMLDQKDTLISREVKEDSFFFHRVEAVVPAIVPYLNKEFWEEYVPEKYREEIENKPDSIYKALPSGAPIDSLYQQRHFNVD